MFNNSHQRSTHALCHRGTWPSPAPLHAMPSTLALRSFHAPQCHAMPLRPVNAVPYRRAEALSVPDINDGQKISKKHQSAQGVCHTYVYWGETPGMDGITPTAVRTSSHFPDTFTAVPTQFLAKLWASPGFLFARYGPVFCPLCTPSLPCARSFAWLAAAHATCGYRQHVACGILENQQWRARRDSMQQCHTSARASFHKPSRGAGGWLAVLGCKGSEGIALMRGTGVREARGGTRLTPVPTNPHPSTSADPELVFVLSRVRMPPLSSRRQATPRAQQSPDLQGMAQIQTPSFRELERPPRPLFTLPLWCGGGDFGGNQLRVGNFAFQMGRKISHTNSRGFREMGPCG